MGAAGQSGGNYGHLAQRANPNNADPMQNLNRSGFPNARRDTMGAAGQSGPGQMPPGGQQRRVAPMGQPPPQQTQRMAPTGTPPQTQPMQTKPLSMPTGGLPQEGPKPLPYNPNPNGYGGMMLNRPPVQQGQMGQGFGNLAQLLQGAGISGRGQMPEQFLYRPQNSGAGK